MINDNTILSSFNDRPTLLEWLKKVEEALKSDTAKSISVDNPETNVYIIKITFADGRVMYTEPIRLPDSVKGVSILNNHLIITMQSGLTDDLGVINPYADTIVSNSETNTTEIRNNAVVGGNMQVDGNVLFGSSIISIQGTTKQNGILGTNADGKIAFKEIGGGGLKLWLHTFTKGPSYYKILMFTNKKVSQISSNTICLPLSSAGPSVENIYYFTGNLIKQGTSTYLIYLRTIDGSLNYNMLDITNFEETITEFVE